MEKEQQELLLLFPSAVLTASGSKGISQRKAPLKFFVKLYYFLIKLEGPTKNKFVSPFLIKLLILKCSRYFGSSGARSFHGITEIDSIKAMIASFSTFESPNGFNNLSFLGSNGSLTCSGFTR